MVNAVGVDKYQNQVNTLKKTCRDFEAIMIAQMIKVMYESLPKDSMIKDNAANSIYKSMYIEALSDKMAENSNLGLADEMFESLKKDLHNHRQKNSTVGNKQKTATPNLMEKIESAVKKASKMYSVPVKLINSIIKAESDFNPAAISSKGAVGLMQLMPKTAKDMGAENLSDIDENILAGTKYLSNLMKQFKNEKMAIAAYNAGPSNVNKYNGLPPFKETRNYVKKVLAYENGKI